jgi:uncharacterized protein involved in exopolysaccharide biosynthesis
MAVSGSLGEGLSQGQPFTLRDFLISGFFHRRIVTIFALLPLIVGAIAAFQAKTDYTSSSLLMVLVNREFSGSQNVTDSGPAVLSIEGLKSVESEIQIIESAETIRNTITAVGLERIFPDTSFIERLRGLFSRGDNPMDDSIARFRRNLSSGVQSGSNIIRVSFSNPDRATAVIVGDELVRVYLERRRLLFQNPTSAILAGEVQRLDGQLKTLDREIEAVKVSANIIDFVQDSVLAANQVDTIVQRRRQVAERVAGVAGQLAEAEKQKTALSETVFDFYQQSDAVANDDDRNLLTRLQTDRNRLTTQYPSSSPNVREIDKKIATVREAMQSPDQKISWTKREVRNPTVSFVTNMILSLSVEQDSLKQQIEELDTQQEAAQKRLAAVRGVETRLIELNRQRDALTDSYREYVKRGQAAKIEETASDVRAANVRVVQNASDAVTRRNLRLPLVAGSLFAALLFGAAAGSAASALRNVFIQPREAERSLHIPRLGEFNDHSDAFDDRDNRFAMAALASRLLDIRVGERRLKTLQVIGLRAEAQYHRFAVAMAREMSEGRNLRTLLIDFANPKTVLSSAAGPDGLIVNPTATPDLWLAVAPANFPATTLRTSVDDTRRMLDDLAQQYDFVIVCAPSQSEMLLTRRFAAVVDANLLVVVGERSREPAIAWLRDVVLESGGNLLGFVFTSRKLYLPRWLYRWF